MNATSLQSELHLPNGHRACVTHIGDIHLTNTIVVKHAYVPTFQCNLLSAAKFNVDNNYDLIFTSSKCVMQILTMRKRNQIGDLEEGLYRLHPESF